MHIFRGAAGSEFICEWCQPSEWTKRRPDLCVIATCPQHGRVWHYRKDAALLDAAPLLLKALEAAEKMIREFNEYQKHDTFEDDSGAVELADKLQALIAAARSGEGSGE